MCVLYSACTGSPPFCSAINTVITVAIRVLLSPLWCPTYSLTVPHRVPAMTLRAPTHFLFLSRLRISTHAKLGWGQGVVQNAKLTVTLRIAFVIILPCSNTSSLCTNHCSEKVWPTYLFEYSHIRPSVSDTCPLTVQSSRCKFGSTSSWKKKKKRRRKRNACQNDFDSWLSKKKCPFSFRDLPLLQGLPQLDFSLKRSQDQTSLAFFLYWPLTCGAPAYNALLIPFTSVPHLWWQGLSHFPTFLCHLC